MAANQYNGNSRLGTGIGLRAPHIDQVLDDRPDIGWFEIISENYLLDGGPAIERLERVLEHYPVIQHGVGLYVGSPDGIDDRHLARLRRLLARTRSPWVSDHLCWGSVDGRASHDLLPLPYTSEAVDVCVRNLRKAKDVLGVPFAVENVSSYAEFHASTMTEWQFLSEVVERADVGILLDVNNIFVSAVNHGFDPYTYLENLPHHRVAQIHVAGHARHDRFVIDTHDHPVSDEVFALYGRALELCGPTPTLLEWDAKIPPLDTLIAEARKTEAYWPRADEVARAG